MMFDLKTDILPTRWSALRFLISTVALLGATLVPSEKSAASSDSSTPLTLTEYRAGYADMVVDELHEQVFVSGGPPENVIVVLDFEGNILGEIQGLQGASGMAIEDTTLYVAMPLTQTIDLIDTETIELIDSFSVAPKRPHEVDLAGGRIWFGYNCASDFPGMASLDPNTGTVIGYRTAGYPFHCPFFATTDANPDLLVAADASGSDVYAYDVSGENPVLLNRRTVDQLRDMAISPDGGTLFVASVTPKGVLAFSLPHLSDAGSYPTTMWKTSVAVSREHLALGGRPYDYWEDEVLIFPLGPGTARNWYKVEPPNVLPRGLRFKPDSSALFALSEGNTVVFHVLEGPTRDGSRVSLTDGPPSVTAGNPVSLSGKLEFPFGGSTAGKSIHGYRKGSDGSWTHFGSTVTDTTGAFFLQDVPTVSDTYRYRAGWSGDADRAGVNSHWFYTTVDPAQATLALKASSPFPLGSLGLGKSLVLTGQLISPFGEDQVDETVLIFRRSPIGSETLVETKTTGTGGWFTFQDTPPALGKWRYRARWAGDAGHLPAESHSLSVNVIPLKTASLTLTTQWPVVRWGHTVILKAQGGALQSENRLISIYQTTVGGTKTLLATRTLGRYDVKRKVSLDPHGGLRRIACRPLYAPEHAFVGSLATIAELSEADQRALLDHLDALLSPHPPPHHHQRKQLTDGLGSGEVGVDDLLSPQLRVDRLPLLSRIAERPFPHSPERVRQTRRELHLSGDDLLPGAVRAVGGSELRSHVLEPLGLARE